MKYTTSLLFPKALNFYNKRKWHSMIVDGPKSCAQFKGLVPFPLRRT